MIKLSGPTLPNVLAKHLGLPSPNKIDEYWTLIENALQAAGLVSCVLNCRCDTRLLLSLRLIDEPQPILSGNNQNKARLLTRRKLNANLSRNHEIWWLHRTLEMEYAGTI